jgi:fluoride exporter
MSEILTVGLFGSVGAIARYLVYRALQSTPRFPVTTLCINILGCFLLGALLVWVEREGSGYRQIYLAGAVGFLGAFTTFSTFGAETFMLMRTGEFGRAGLNVGASVVLGVLAVWAGRMAAGE